MHNLNFHKEVYSPIKRQQGRVLHERYPYEGMNDSIKKRRKSDSNFICPYISEIYLT